VWCRWVNYVLGRYASQIWCAGPFWFARSITSPYLAYVFGLGPRQATRTYVSSLPASIRFDACTLVGSRQELELAILPFLFQPNLINLASCQPASWTRFPHSLASYSQNYTAGAHGRLGTIIHPASPRHAWCVSASKFHACT
jgi:hypothetical protein